MRAERAKLSWHSDVAKAMDYILKRWPLSRPSATTDGICSTAHTLPGDAASAPSSVRGEPLPAALSISACSGLYSNPYTTVKMWCG
jgi:hypothetical protein